MIADELLARARSARPRLGRVQVVAVDGPAGSGKTTLADSLASAGATVLHLDDLYEGWSGLEGSLWPRLSVQVLEPLRRGVPGRYQRYDWSLEAFAEWVDVPVPDVLVLEGCGSARRQVDPVAVLRVWVEAPADLRLARGLARDGAEMRAHWVRWMADEAAHFARERTRERADVRLDAFGDVLTDGSVPGASTDSGGR
ncbi:uridine kinase [Cellulomonas xylanilytica]|uniref:Uridine kinase n=1 Tax=Cellulomonas xylanilytica TaxID=233583 RepID=A0A510V0Y5_9CELL|nr:uridine kinase [Cellulomonas xylanilytica]GEK20568.1 uridine kinase [Cellulomonas xylanilytica]